MEYQEFIEIKKKLYEHFLCFIDDDNNIDDNFNELNEMIHIHKFNEKPDEFKSILYLISEINKNHHRSLNDLLKIEQFISYYEEFIKQSFTKEELFNVFQKNPQILHFLFTKNIITIDDSIIKLLLNPPKSIFVLRQYQGEKDPDTESAKQNFKSKIPINHNYQYYFFLDIKTKLSKEEKTKIENELLNKDENIFDNFEEKCRTGENDSHICSLIRKDSIKEFIIYTNMAGISLTSEVIPSIFETNPFLISKPATLIEYAAFFGSIQIFQYLKMNRVALTPSLWLYAIHGKNPDIIHILEESHIEPEDVTFMECLKESIKCHHNAIAFYIQNNLMKEQIKIDESNFNCNPLSCGFHYYNYAFLDDYRDIHHNYQFPFYYACLYDHFNVVEFLIKMKKVDLNQKIIPNHFFVLIKQHSTFQY